MDVDTSKYTVQVERLRDIFRRRAFPGLNMVLDVFLHRVDSVPSKVLSGSFSALVEIALLFHPYSLMPHYMSQSVPLMNTLLIDEWKSHPGFFDVCSLDDLSVKWIGIRDMTHFIVRAICPISQRLLDGERVMYDLAYLYGGLLQTPSLRSHLRDGFKRVFAGDMGPLEGLRSIGHLCQQHDLAASKLPPQVKDAGHDSMFRVLQECAIEIGSQWARDFLARCDTSRPGPFLFACREHAESVRAWSESVMGTDGMKVLVEKLYDILVETAAPVLLARVGDAIDSNDVEYNHTLYHILKMYAVHDEKMVSIFRDKMEQRVPRKVPMKDVIPEVIWMSRIVAEHYGSGARPVAAMRMFLTTLVNSGPDYPSQLATLIGEWIGNPKLSESELDVLWDAAIQLIQHIHDRDNFEAAYRFLCSNRLMHPNAKLDLEEAAIARLKMNLGGAFTSKLEHMIHDRRAGEGLNAEFVAALGHPSTLSVHVLTMGCWPRVDVPQYVFPAHLNAQLQEFSAFYVGKHRGRRLEWCHTFGSMTLQASFAKGNKQIIGTVLQGLTLLLFANVGPHTIQQVADALHCTVDAAKLSIAALTLGAYKILEKCGDVYQYARDSFASDSRAIRLPVPKVRITQDDTQKIAEDVARNRKILMSACIVRLMKARKTMSHTDLMNEAISALSSRIPVDPRELKAQIGTLIDEEYIERCADNASYVYKA